MSRQKIKQKPATDYIAWANAETVRRAREWVSRRSKTLGVWLVAAVLFALVTPARAADQRVTLTITVTNLPVTSNTLIFTAPVSKTITWTNVAGSANVVTGATIAASTTNLYLQLAAYRIGSPPLSLGVLTNTNTFELFGAVNQDITVSQAGSAGGNWATLTLSTQTITRLTTVRVPIASEVGTTNRTNIGSLLVLGISDFSTNRFDSNSTAMAHFVSTGTNAQQILGDKTFYKLGGTNIGLTNGWYVTGTNISPYFSNAINLGNAFRSEGVGSNSLQIGSNALAKALRTIAIGADAFATNTDAVAIGPGAIATNQNTIAIGRLARTSASSGTAIGQSAVAAEGGIAIGDSAAASGYIDIAIGSEAVASGGYSVAVGAASGATGTNSVAIGETASAAAPQSTAVGKGATVAATHTNSMALGRSATTTTNHQLMLGSADVFLVETYARLQAGSITNGLLTGTNRVDGDLSFTRYDASSVANGNNVAQPFTNVNVEVTGPTADFAICGIIGGRNGRFIKIQNNTAYVMTIAHESGVDPTAANRIQTPTRTDITVQSNGWARFTYDATSSRWELEDVYPATALSTNSFAAGSTTQVQYNNGGLFDGASGITIPASLGETNLHVSGTNNVAYFTMTTGAAVNELLVTDASGRATWQKINLTNDHFSNVTPVAQSDGQVLKWNSTHQTWTNAADNGGSGSGQFYDFSSAQFDTNSATPVVVTIKSGAIVSNLVVRSTAVTSVPLRVDTYADPNTNSFQVGTNSAGTHHFLVASNGNVGIGTNIPQQKLHIPGTVLFDGGNAITFEPVLGTIDIGGGELALGPGKVSMTLPGGGFISITNSDTPEPVFYADSLGKVFGKAEATFGTTLRVSTGYFTNGVTNASLTASRPMLTDANKMFVSGQIDLSSANHVTGTLADGSIPSTITRDTEWLHVKTNDITLGTENILNFRGAGGSTITGSTGTGSNVVTVTSTRVGVWRTIEIPAAAWQTSITNGADYGTNNTLSSDYTTVPVFDFDDTTSQSVEINFRMPLSWDLGTVKYAVDFFSGATAGTNAWELKAKAVADNESAAGTWGTGVNVYKLVSSTANRQNSTTNSAALTIGGSPAAGERVYWKLSRLPGDAFDNLVGDARLAGVTIFYQESTTEPSAP